MGRAASIVLPAEARPLADEVPIALVYNGTTQAVMMASPSDLEDFALGFSLTEGIVASPDELQDLEIVHHGAGIEVRMWLSQEKQARLTERRRAMVGPVGCGLCGIDSIEAALRPAAQVATQALELSAIDLRQAPAALRMCQPLHDRTHAAHAAGLWEPGKGLLLAREDIGRHNALDKLVGAAGRAGLTGKGRAVVLTSRVSVEMVQKAAALGAEAILAVSAPTGLAVSLADAARITLVGGLKGDGEIHTHPQRISEGAQL